MEQEVKYGEDGKLTPDNGGLSQYVTNLFKEFKSARQPFEDMWIECWWNYLGQYQKDLNWRPETEGENGNSRIFIKATTVKCNTAHAKVMDMAFSKDGGESVPFSGEPIMLPIHEQMGITPEQLKEASKRMIDKIKGHHKAIDLIEQIDTGTLEMAILGTAVIKGPMLSPVVDTKYNVRTIMGMPVNAFDPNINPYQRIEETVHRPDFIHIPLWGYYCDPNAKSAKDSVMEMHYDRMLPGDFRKLCSTGGFIEENVKAAEARAGGGAGDDANLKYIMLGDNYMGEEGEKDKRIPVLEAWGWVKVSDIKSYAKEGTLPKDAKDDDYIEAGVWLAADGLCIKACVNTLGRRPFKVCPWKKVPHQVFGHGVAWSMRDSQKMINSSMRMIIDNKALTGPGMLAVNLDRINTKKTRNMKVYPKKIFYVKGNFSPKDAIDTVKFTDVTRELRELRMDFERFADEETSIPKLEEGQQASFLNKMLDITTPVPMADGSFKQLADIVDGDILIGSDGMPTTVITAHPVSYPKTAYELKFRSGETVIAGGEHLWTVHTSKTKTLGKFPVRINTDTIYNRHKKSKVKFFIPKVQRPKFGSGPLPLDPYMLGLWLGDGHTHDPRITTADPFIVDYITSWAQKNGCTVTADKYQNAGKATTYSIVAKNGGARNNETGQYNDNGSFRCTLKTLGVFKNKHIPEIYQRSSYEDRLSLLRGLMDTDGCHNSGALTIFSQKEGAVVSGVMRLIAGLGGFPRTCRVDAGKLAKENTLYWNVNFSISDNPFLSPLKADKWKPPITSIEYQSITSIKITDIREMRCLTVDATDGLFCVGNRFTLTHNTAAGMSMLMGRTNVNIKPAIKNIDDFWIEPIVEEEYLWFMDMEPDQSIKIPMKIRATGISTLIANEIKMENYAKFMQVTGANPQDAIMVDREKAIRNWAAMLDTEDIMRTPDQIKQLLEMAAQEGNKPKDIKEYIAIDKLFPLLTPAEQSAIVQMLGVQPDQQGRGIVAALKIETMKAENEKLQAEARKNYVPDAPEEIDPQDVEIKNEQVSQARLDTEIKRHQVEKAKIDVQMAASPPADTGKKFKLKKSTDGGFEGTIGGGQGE